MARQNAHRTFSSGDLMRAVIRTIRSDDTGVASTVGTTMALLVFLTFLSLIVNQYVPAWMKESEAAHANNVLGQFGNLKGQIDVQILAAHMAANANPPREYVPVEAIAAVGLGVDGVPVFSGSTTSTMTAFQTAGPFTVVFDYNVCGASCVLTRVSDVSNGSIDIEMHNRYYIAQRVAYENGAVIRSQGDGQVIRGAPIFSAANANNVLALSFALVTLYGGGTVAGTNTEVIKARLFTLDPQTYRNFPPNGALWINHTSRYGLAWYQFFNETLGSALKLGGTFTKSTLDLNYTAKIGATVIYGVSSSYNPTNQMYTTRLVMYNRVGVGLPQIGSFQFVHAHVQVKVGETSI